MRRNMLKTLTRKNTNHTIRGAKRWLLGSLAALALAILGTSPATAGDEFERAFRYEFGGTLGRIAAHKAVGVGRAVLGEVIGGHHGHAHYGARYHNPRSGSYDHYGAYSRHNRHYDRHPHGRYDRYDRGSRYGYFNSKKHRRQHREHRRHHRGGGCRGSNCD